MTQTPPSRRSTNPCPARRAWLLLALLLAGLAAPAAAQTRPPPDGDWVTFRTDHFRVTYPPELDDLARRAAVVAERTYAVLEDELMEPPDGTIDLVVTDHVDYANGYATPFPSPRMVVFARPPTVMPQLAYTRDWLESVVAHELVHVFHMPASGPLGDAVRFVFGDVPMLWPVFPVVGSPTWHVEGLATHYETRLTGTGRVVGSFHDMIIRTAALEARIPSLDEVSVPHPGWPGGQRSYGYGSRLMHYVAERYGTEALGEIVEATAGSLRPTFMTFDHVADRAVGEPFDRLYREWRIQATDSARAVAERIRAQGVTRTVPVAGTGPLAAAPRLSPDGTRLSFAAHDYRSDAATRVVDLRTGRVRTLQERNQFGSMLGPAAWRPDGDGLVMAQLEARDRHRMYSDLWALDATGERRLTRGQRLAQPDVAPDGRRVVAVQAEAGSIRLVVHDLVSGETRRLLEPGSGEAFDRPRWSPDGRRVVVSRFAGGRVDVVVADVATGRITPITDDDALDLAPTWSPDGEWLLWWSDRTGVPNIMAGRAPDGGGAVRAGAGLAGAGPVGRGGGEAETLAAPDNGGVFQVTNMLTGAFDPAVSPDGRTLYLSVYHHDGWRIERMPFRPGSWQRDPHNVMGYREGLLEAPGPGDAAAVDASASAYSPWPTLRPYYWLPTWSRRGGSAGELFFLGLRTEGEDVLGRHRWQLSATVDPGSGRFKGWGAWTFRGLRNVDLRGALSREWDQVGLVEVEDGREGVFRRTDEAAFDAYLWRPRWRHNAWLRLGADVERRVYEPFDMSEAELARQGHELPTDRTVLGISGGPGYSSAEREPLSISAEDGISGSFALGRWWNTSTGGRAYDEVLGRLSGYLDFPAWGFADHVLAGRVAGLARRGSAAFTRSIGGVPGGSSGLPSYTLGILGGAGSTWLPVRGFDEGVRRGTRAWTASVEWRFPIRLEAAPGELLGFSLTSFSGSVFADAGDAWCSAAQLENAILAHGCARAAEAPLVSVGAELSVAFGLMHSLPGLLRIGVAQPVQGPDPLEPRLYLGLGRAF